MCDYGGVTLELDYVTLHHVISKEFVTVTSELDCVTLHHVLNTFFFFRFSYLACFFCILLTSLFSVLEASATSWLKTMDLISYFSTSSFLAWLFQSLICLNQVTSFSIFLMVTGWPVVWVAFMSGLWMLFFLPFSENYSRITASMSAFCNSQPPHPLVAAINSSLTKSLPTHPLLALCWATVLKSLSYSDPSYWYKLIETGSSTIQGLFFIFKEFLSVLWT